MAKLDQSKHVEKDLVQFLELSPKPERERGEEGENENDQFSNIFLGYFTIIKNLFYYLTNYLYLFTINLKHLINFLI